MMGNSIVCRKGNTEVNFEEIIGLRLLPGVIDETLKVWLSFRRNGFAYSKITYYAECR